MSRPQVEGGDGDLQICRIVVNIFRKQSKTTGKRWSFIWGFWLGVNSSSS
jgi:hypothetical protein